MTSNFLYGKRLIEENGDKGNMVDKIIYTGIFLDISGEERQGLLARFSNIYDVPYLHHLTLEFRPTDVSQVPFGKEVFMRVIGQIQAEGIQIFAIDPDSLDVTCANNTPHITVATERRVAPARANKVLNECRSFERLDFYVPGRVGAYLEDGRIAYENEWGS